MGQPHESLDRLAEVDPLAVIDAADRLRFDALNRWAHRRVTDLLETWNEQHERGRLRLHQRPDPPFVEVVDGTVRAEHRAGIDATHGAYGPVDIPYDEIAVTFDVRRSDGSVETKYPTFDTNRVEPKWTGYDAFTRQLIADELAAQHGS